MRKGSRPRASMEFEFGWLMETGHQDRGWGRRQVRNRLCGVWVSVWRRWVFGWGWRDQHRGAELGGGARVRVSMKNVCHQVGLRSHMRHTVEETGEAPS